MSLKLERRSAMEKNYQIEKVKFERDDFLVDVILQNNATKEVLFGASMSEETLRETIEKGLVVLYSKSRKTRWFKG
jgi:phosphoribosyl-ATP pyrophosphohydrolase/phosphoribosyl-AMP cyclohydrolase